MARDLSKLSTTPASNDSAGGWQTGMKPSSVKAAGWADESIIAQLFNSKTASVGTNTITLTNPVPFTSLTTGLLCVFTPANANTGAVTFAPDGLTARAINAYGAALQGGELSTSVPAWVQYDLANTVWNLINPQRNTNADYAAAAGTNTITVTIPGLTALYDGLRIKIKFANTTTAAWTVNANGLGAKNPYVGDFATLAPAGSAIQNNIGELVYNTSLNAAAGGWEFTNPSPVTGSFTGTGVGFSPTVPTETFNYTRNINTAIVSTASNTGLSGTSNSTSFSITGLPSILFPSATRYNGTVALDNTVGTFARMGIDNAGVWTMYNTAGTAAAAWTNVGTKALRGGSWSYQI